MVYTIHNTEIEIQSLLFDAAWYLKIYHDVAELNADPLQHYLTYGYKEGRNPNRFFSTNFYTSTYPDIANCHINPFIHYILYGASEGRLPRPEGQAPTPELTEYFNKETKISHEAIETTNMVEVMKEEEDITNVTPFVKPTLHLPSKKEKSVKRKISSIKTPKNNKKRAIA